MSGQPFLVTSSSDDGALMPRPCELCTVNVGTPESAKTLAIYDSATTTANKVAEILLTTVGHYCFDARLANGLYVDTNATGTARVTIVVE